MLIEQPCITLLSGKHYSVCFRHSGFQYKPGRFQHGEPCCPRRQAWCMYHTWRSGQASPLSHPQRWPAAFLLRPRPAPAGACSTPGYVKWRIPTMKLGLQQRHEDINQCLFLSHLLARPQFSIMAKLFSLLYPRKHRWTVQMPFLLILALQEGSNEMK